MAPTSATAAPGVRSTQLRQDGLTVQWSVELGRSRQSTDFDHASGGGICATLRTKGPAAHLCLARSHTHWAAFLGKTPLTDPVELVGSRTVRVSLPLREVPVPAGPLRWSVKVDAANCAGAATATTRTSAAADTSTATATTPPPSFCESRFPRKGQLRDQLWQPYATGCTRTGAGQVTAGPTTDRVIALTYDDGPSAYTAQMRAVLKREGVVATFFELGQSIAGREAEVRGLLADGDELADHSWNHANLGGGGGGASDQMSRTNAAIRKATGFTPCLFRPPYGATGSDLVSRANAAGMTSVLWSVDTDDWQLPGADTIASRVMAGAAPGHIILMHDGGGPRDESVAASATVIPALKREGYRFVTVSQLLGNRTTYGLRPVA